MSLSFAAWYNEKAFQRASPLAVGGIFSLARNSSDFFAKKSFKKLLEQSAIRWRHLIAAFCGKNKNLESFAT